MKEDNGERAWWYCLLWNKAHFPPLSSLLFHSNHSVSPFFCRTHVLIALLVCNGTRLVVNATGW